MDDSIRSEPDLRQSHKTLFLGGLLVAMVFAALAHFGHFTIGHSSLDPIFWGLAGLGASIGFGGLLLLIWPGVRVVLISAAGLLLLLIFWALGVRWDKL